MMAMVFLCQCLQDVRTSLQQWPPFCNNVVTPSGTIKAVRGCIQRGWMSDPDGTLTFEWDFGDGNTVLDLQLSILMLSQATHSRLAVGDGTHEVTTSKSITVVDSSAREPEAKITPSKDDDCDGEESTASGDLVIVWVCDEDNDVNDRQVEVSTTVNLDASESWAGCDPDDSNCYAEEYLVEWHWDLDTYVDSDGDGITDNDVDASGETYSWEERTTGAWEVKLTVVDNNGFEDSITSMVYVNYRSLEEFVIDRATPNNPIL